MEHDGHRQRLKKRFLKDEMETFQPHEILELLLGYAIPRRDTNPLGHALIDHFGSFSRVLEASVEELVQVPGMGEHSATLIHMILPIIRQYNKEKFSHKEQYETYAKIEAYCKGLFVGMNHECLHLLCFDAQMHMLKDIVVSRGTTNRVNVHTREVIASVISSNATGVVLSHNHPSGSCKPSEQDIIVTDLIKRTCEAINVVFYDHVIVAWDKVFSFQNEGMFDVRFPLSGFKSERVQSKFSVHEGEVVEKEDVKKKSTSKVSTKK